MLTHSTDTSALRRGSAAVAATFVVAGSALSGALIGAGTAAADPVVSSAHRPGDAGFGVNLPADTTMTTTDGRQVTHPCAGRKLLYHSHVDALYGTRDAQGALSVMAVDGQSVVPMDDVCFRLAPDADADGNEVSRITVPDSDALSFMGAPGDVVWTAPQSVSFFDQWRPIWAGLGAFDPNHELDGRIPTNFVDDLMYFDLKEFSGPGDMNVFFAGAGGAGDVEHAFSSADETKHSIDYEVGAHGHFTWTFTKPGIYATTWQGRAELIDGTQELTTPVTMYWLVGTDEQAGLPKGTTTELRPITNPLAPTDTPAPAPAPGPSPGPSQPPAPSNPPSGPSTPAPRLPNAAEKCQAAKALAGKPDTIITHGHLDIALAGGGDKPITFELLDGSDPANTVSRPSGTFALTVPDAAKVTPPAKIRESLPGQPETLWSLPQSQKANMPWPGFSTDHLAPGVLASGSTVTVSISDYTGPGRMLAWHESLGGLKIAFDSHDRSHVMQYPARAHDHMAFGFDRPGYYTVRFNVSGETTAGESIDHSIDVPFLVGDKTIAAAKAHKAAGYMDLGNADELCAGLPSAPSVASPWTPQSIGQIGTAVQQLGKALDGTLKAAAPKRTNTNSTTKGNITKPATKPAPGHPGGTAPQNQAGAPAPAHVAAPANVAQPAAVGGGVAQPAPAGAAEGIADVVEDAAEEVPPVEVGEEGAPIKSSISGMGVPDEDTDRVDSIGGLASLTAGGFWSGLALGVGVMALIGGIVLFNAARRLIKDLEKAKGKR